MIYISVVSLVIAIYAHYEDLRTGGAQHYPENSKHVRTLKLTMLDKLKTRDELISKYFFKYSILLTFFRMDK